MVRHPVQWIVAMLLLAGFACSHQINSEEFANAAGWNWLIPPRPSEAISWSTMGVVAIASEDKDGAYTITLAWKPAEGSIYRAVAFDEERRRFEMGEPLGASSGDPAMTRYRLDPKLL